MIIGETSDVEPFLNRVRPGERSGLSDQLRDNRPRHPWMPVDNSGRISAGKSAFPMITS
jgi:hypothetical protein